MVSPAGVEPAVSSSRTTYASAAHQRGGADSGTRTRASTLATPRSSLEPCLPWSCHIPSCKRTMLQKSGAPPGIRTRRTAFLRRGRIPIPPAGQNKKPGDLAGHPGFGGSRRISSLSLRRRRLHAHAPRGESAIARPARSLAASASFPGAALSGKAFPSFRCRGATNASRRAALTRKSKRRGTAGQS
jgi:hypothetical protein